MLKRACRLSLAAAALYGVQSHGASPVDAAEAKRLHERMLVLDTHLDAPANFVKPGWNVAARHSFDDDGSQVDLPRMIEGGLDGGFWAIYTGQGPRTSEGFAAARDTALLRALSIHEVVARNPQHFELALTSADAARIAAQGKRVVYLSIENGYPLGLDPTLLQTFYSLGVRLFGPVHFRNNDLADSATDPAKEWNGLSPLGKRLVVEANRLGIVLDASHASDDVLDQLIELSRTPVMLSHSGCKAVFDHPRNIDDDRLRKLAASGGVIQMNSLGAYLKRIPPIPQRDKAFAELSAKYGPAANLSADKAAELRQARRAIEKQYPLERATFEDFMNHLLHALRLVGPDHVGIGADWDGGGGVIGMDDVTALPKITARLLQEGYSAADIEKIWSGNALRVLKAAEDYAQRAGTE
ncbi:dipeptidase [Steroidobacter cummioxidans]|uniref:dipeptidase n=1 Tax=Steroidobacter cummioxidans TaxID=1803913 RepID=UPI000E30B48E